MQVVDKEDMVEISVRCFSFLASTMQLLHHLTLIHHTIILPLLAVDQCYYCSVKDTADEHVENLKKSWKYMPMQYCI